MIILIQALTISRLISAPLLLVFIHQPVVFGLLYAWCGLSDAADGWLARHYGLTSTLGARLDSAADMAAFLSIAASCWVLFPAEVITFIPWLAAILAVRLVNLLIGGLRFHALVWLHTWANKLAGLVVFLTPLAYRLTGWQAILWLACLASLFSALEECLIMLRMSSLDLNKRSLFF
ncbi:MAG TPA: CDP-alcohol phosphatidyltransferase family protein [Bellilinea sp.]|nr:CDP-alcohol phosphatidyltransferase family protein [Bellilinea sp.]